MHVTQRISTAFEEGSYLGAPCVRRTINGLTLTRKNFPAGYPLQQLPQHTHEELCLCTILKGSMAEIDPYHTRMFTPLTTILHPIGEAHRDQVGPDGICILSLELSDDWLQRLQASSISLEQPSVHKN